jgi:hypothetical protein
MHERLLVQLHQHVTGAQQGTAKRVAMTADVLRQ